MTKFVYVSLCFEEPANTSNSGTLGWTPTPKEKKKKRLLEENVNVRFKRQSNWFFIKPGQHHSLQKGRLVILSQGHNGAMFIFPGGIVFIAPTVHKQ